MASFSLAGVYAILGIMHDQHKWPAVLVAAIAGGFLFLMLLWNGLA
jgi:hypothetical protein